MLHKLRITSQGLFLLIFLWLFLQTESKGADKLSYPVKIFLDADPLVVLATIFSSHSWYKTFYIAILIVFITIFLGRIFCGWVCPLGTLNNLVGSLNKKRHIAAKTGLYRLKYLILLFLLTASLLSFQLTGFVDPLTLLIRSLSLAVYPGLSYALSAAFDAVYQLNAPFITGISEPAYILLKKFLLPFQQPYFYQSFIIGVLFLVILWANLIDKRFWCKYLCPLGALLGLLSRFALLGREVSEGCNSCGACLNDCQGAADPEKKEKWKKAECLICMNCDDICPQNAVQFGFLKMKSAPLDLGKRRMVGSILAGLMISPLMNISPIKRLGVSYPKLIRPPGALDEKQFLTKCIKCGECMKVCITNGLQPAFLEGGIEGIWSPVLVPQVGYCEFRCTLCGQVCPTGAIQKLKLSEKSKVKIGTAMIDKGRCLPHAHATPCIVCQEVCPTAKKAIWLERTTVKKRSGEELIVYQPHVDLERCVGCGICEAKCPVLGKPAIYVINIGESRSKENQLLL
jgi:polyferredoxin